MNRFLLWLVLGVPVGLLPAQVLSPAAEVSLLTCAPGADLYSAFGHSAVRVYDPVNRLDQVYNYGTFDFDPPGFYLEFARGKLNYRLDVDPFGQFERAYRYFQRSYYEQVLDLSPAQKQAVYLYLEDNFRPENRYYLYDFFFDNCATRIWDVLDAALGDSIRWAATDEPGPDTFREMLDHGLAQRPWADLGIDLALGAVIDRPATYRERAFLPDYLAEAVGQAEVSHGGRRRPLVQEARPLFEAPPPFGSTPWYLHPWLWLMLLPLGLGWYTWRSWGKGSARAPLDATFFMLAGLAGWVLLLLWVATDHIATAANWNVLWLLPTHLLVGPLLFMRARPAWVKTYFRVATLLITLLLLGWWWLPQALNPMFLPLMAALLLRTAGQGWGGR
ncbi:MAG: DUF4105 domain-containing protein [Bacteroidetes bacterium]|nr:MAG: DUF4105 domain-containing protein [Bacteroidota bacterium]